MREKDRKLRRRRNRRDKVLKKRVLDEIAQKAERVSASKRSVKKPPAAAEASPAAAEAATAPPAEKKKPAAKKAAPKKADTPEAVPTAPDLGEPGGEEGA